MKLVTLGDFTLKKKKSSLYRRVYWMRRVIKRVLSKSRIFCSDFVWSLGRKPTKTRELLNNEFGGGSLSSPKAFEW